MESLSLLLHVFISLKALLSSTYIRKLILTQCVKWFIGVLKKIIYAQDVKNYNLF